MKRSQLLIFETKKNFKDDVWLIPFRGISSQSYPLEIQWPFTRNGKWTSPRVCKSCCGSLTSWLLCSCRFRSFLKPLKRSLGNVVSRLPPRFSFNPLRLRLWKTFGGNACNLLCETSKLVRFSRSNSLESHFLRLLWLKSITDKFNLSKRPGGNSSNAFWLRFSNFKELKFLRLWMQVGNPINGFGSHMAPLPTIRQWEGAHHKPGNLWFSKGPCELFRWE